MPAPELLERDGELAEVGATLDAAACAEGGLLLIEGAAGAGKTSLLDAAVASAEQRGMRVLRARGGEFEQDFPYGVVRQLLGPLRSGQGDGVSLLSGRASLVSRAFEAGAAAEALPFDVQEGLYWLTSDLAEAGPLLLVVDDAQWADAPSLQALTFVARRLEGLGAAILVAVRTGEDASCREILDELRSQPLVRSVAPGPLSAAAVAALAESEGDLRPSSAFAEACRSATGGNPFLLIELLRVLEAEGADLEEESGEDLARRAADGASRAILTRLARMRPQESEVARAVAILEPNAEQRLVAAMTGIGDKEVVEAGERLLGAALLSGARPLAFTHPLVREAVLSEMGAARRGAAHAGAARLLADGDAEADIVASHLLLSVPAGDPWAVAQLRASAESAMSRGAPVAAVSYLRRALAEPPPKPDRVEVRRELGFALIRADDPEGIEVLGAVRGEIEDRAARAEATAVLSNSVAFRGRSEEAAAILAEALAENGDDSGPLGVYLRLHAFLLMSGGVEHLPAGAAPTPDEDLGPPSTTTRALWSQAALMTGLGLGSMDTAVRLAERVGLDPKEEEIDAIAGFPHNPSHMTLTLADRGDLVIDRFERNLESSSRRGTLSGVTAVYGTRAYCRVVEGELAEAQVDGETGARLAHRAGFWISTESWSGAALRAQAARGDFAAARSLLQGLLGDRVPGSGMPGALLLLGRGELRRAEGDHRRAAEDFRGAGERLSWLPLANPEGVGWRPGLALSLVALGEAEEATALAAETVELAARAGGSRGIGVALRVQGTIAGEDGIETLREAIEILAATRARPQLALALVELGAALRRANHRREAREPLREGLEIAHRIGAGPLAERARTELAAAGARPRSAVRSGVEALTPSELRVARLASEGLTNREIAQSLTVSAKTVETHLRHVFQKLDLSGREQLAAALGSGQGS